MTPGPMVSMCVAVLRLMIDRALANDVAKTRPKILSISKLSQDPYCRVIIYVSHNLDIRISTLHHASSEDPSEKHDLWAPHLLSDSPSNDSPPL